MDDRPRFALLPHTADLRATLDAPDAVGLAQAAVDFARTVLVAESPVAATELRTVHPEGEGEDERFFRFLRELFYWFDVDGFLPALASGAGPWTVWGERFDPARHVAERQVKALTRHGYRYEAGPAGHHVELVLDL